MTELEPVTGPFPANRIDGSAAGLGTDGTSMRALIDAGLTPPDLLTGSTLHLLANQPRRPRPAAVGDDDRPARASAIDGGVWVREQVVFHRPLPRDDRFQITGRSLHQYVKKGRQYGVTASAMVTSEGEPCVTNLTTGLLRYAPVDDGPSEKTSPAVVGGDDPWVPRPEPSGARRNPSRDRLATLDVGPLVRGPSTSVSLDLMVARDGGSSPNPIHTDPEAARRAGLSAPIAGGNHVLSFVFEAILGELGSEAFLHGSALDVRWRRPVYTDMVVYAEVDVRSASAGIVELAFSVPGEGEGGPHLVGTLAIPVGPAASGPS